MSKRIEKVYLEYARKIDDEWGTFTKTFNDLNEAMDFISISENVYTFKIKLIKKDS